VTRSDQTVVREWVLVIDDDADSRDALRLVLHDGGYGVETADSAGAGLRLFATRAWDVVVLDLQLPDGSGLDVLRAIRATVATTPVIMVTGHSSMASAVGAVNESAFAYLEKPVAPEGLLRVVARALARRHLEDDRRRLAAIVEGSEDAIIAETLDGTIVTWNAGAERLYGYAPPETIGRPISLLQTTDHDGEVAEILTRLRRGERVEHYETVHVRKDGRKIDVSLTVSPIRDASGAVIGGSAIARDITPRKRAEATTRALIQVSHELAGSLEVEQVTQRVVSILLELFRVRGAALFRREPLSGALTYVAIAGEGDADALRGQALPPGAGLAGLAVVEGRPVWSRDLLDDPRLVVPDWLATALEAGGLRAGVAAPLLDRGDVVGALTLADGVGRVFGAEELAAVAAFADQAALAIRNARLFEEVRQQRDVLQSVAENSADGIVTTDVRGRITYVSPGAVRMFGHRADEALGQRVASFYRRGSAEAWSLARRLQQHGEVRDYETALRGKHGGWIPVSASVSLLRDARGRVVGTLGVIRDLTEREAAEAARREATELRAVTTLAAGVAHEVNNPLAVIAGQLELLALACPPEGREAKRIERALQSVREIKQIAGRLSRITRIRTTTADRSLPPILDISRSAGEVADAP
jgi:PAS domain S-box-containing protein